MSKKEIENFAPCGIHNQVDPHAGGIHNLQIIILTIYIYTNKGHYTYKCIRLQDEKYYSDTVRDNPTQIQLKFP